MSAPVLKRRPPHPAPPERSGTGGAGTRPGGRPSAGRSVPALGAPSAAPLSGHFTGPCRMTCLWGWTAPSWGACLAPCRGPFTGRWGPGEEPPRPHPLPGRTSPTRGIACRGAGKAERALPPSRRRPLRTPHWRCREGTSSTAPGRCDGTALVAGRICLPPLRAFARVSSAAKRGSAGRSTPP